MSIKRVLEFFFFYFCINPYGVTILSKLYRIITPLGLGKK